MKESQFRKMVREEIENVMSEVEVPEEEAKESAISQIYQWIIKGDMKRAMDAMQNDPELLRLANNVDDLKKELIRRMSKDDVMLQLIVNAINTIKKKKGIS